MRFLLTIVDTPTAEPEVSIFDNLQTFLEQLVEFFSQVLNGLRFIPTLIHDSGALIVRYSSMFPPLILFIVGFLFSGGIILKLLHWGD